MRVDVLMRLSMWRWSTGYGKRPGDGVCARSFSTARSQFGSAKAHLDMPLSSFSSLEALKEAFVHYLLLPLEHHNEIRRMRIQYTYLLSPLAAQSLHAKITRTEIILQSSGRYTPD